MLFNSYVFLFGFLPAVLAGWWLIPKKQGRLIFLTLASYFFYGWWDWRFVPLMLASSTADYIAGARIAESSSRSARRRWLIALLVFNLGLLGFFKYFDFFSTSLNGLARWLGQDLDLPLLKLILPIGISFYTFNSISYTIDVYRGRIAPAKSLLEFSAFVAMFPHLIAGPIVRYADMRRQFDALPIRPQSGQFVIGAWFFALGMLKKIGLADPIAEHFVTPQFADIANMRFETAWLAALSYSLQIYFDFSGYSDMAVGLALFLGLQFPKNFDSPYKASNIAEFWRRWHMSLSFWLRDYLFIPLGGSHGSRVKTLRNLGVTMLLGGLWHGASWTFVVWGLYHGSLLGGHAALRSRGWLPRSKPLGIATTFILVVIGWVFFRAASLPEALQMLSAMAGQKGIGSGEQIRQLVTNRSIVFVLLGLAIVWFGKNTWELRFPRNGIAALALACALFGCTLRFAIESPFLYFQF
jgi:alginate O-acetyltransferase complex protein AlgI